MFYISYTTMMLITSIYNIKKHMYKYTQNMHLNQWFNYKINFLLIVIDISSTIFFRYIDIIDTLNGVSMATLLRTAVVTKQQFTANICQSIKFVKGSYVINKSLWKSMAQFLKQCLFICLAILIIPCHNRIHRSPMCVCFHPQRLAPL